MSLEKFPYTYDCWVQEMLQGKEHDYKRLRELVLKNKEKDYLLSGEEVKILPSFPRLHREIIEKAVKDSYDLAEELGLKNPIVKVSAIYGISYERVRQIVKNLIKRDTLF